MATQEKNTISPEKRRRMNDIILHWKKDVAEAETNFEARQKTPEYKAMLKRLREKNAERGIIIPE